MSDAFLSSDDFDEQAHQLYNEGRYDDALIVLKEGIALYPHAVELHIGRAYAHLAREEFAWSRRSFEQALGLDPDHEDGLAGVGETMLKMGDREAAMKSFERILQLGFQDDHELMLQVGRSLFREGLIGPAHRFFDLAAHWWIRSPASVAAGGRKLTSFRPAWSGIPGRAGYHSRISVATGTVTRAVRSARSLASRRRTRLWSTGIPWSRKARRRPRWPSHAKAVLTRCSSPLHHRSRGTHSSARANGSATTTLSVGPHHSRRSVIAKTVATLPAYGGCRPSADEPRRQLLSHYAEATQAGRAPATMTGTRCTSLLA